MKLARLYQRDYLDPRLLFVFIAVYYILFTYIWQEYLFTDNIYYNSFAEQISEERIKKYIFIQRKLWWMSFILLPMVLLVKTTLVAICLNVGTLFSDLKVKFAHLFRIALVAEIIFVLASFVRLGWLYFFIDYHTIRDIKMFYPFSLLNILQNHTPAWLAYPLQTLNLFEVGYWLLLAFGLKQYIQWSFTKTTTLVLLSYGLGLIIWSVFIMFLSVNFS